MTHKPWSIKHFDSTSARSWLVTVSLYLITATATIHLTSDGRDIATIWPANAILLALLLADDKPRWLPILAAGFFGNVAANMLTRGTLAAPLLFSVANLIEIVIATQLIGPARAKPACWARLTLRCVSSLQRD